jgi:agmatine deiminase
MISRRQLLSVSGALLEAFGGEKVVWAPGVKGVDITDYHIDSLARFIEPGTVLIQLPDTVAADDP